MDITDYLRIVADEIHSVVVATVDEKDLPSTRVIDIMLYDENGLYFLTAKGKVFYKQLMEKSYLSLSAMTSGPDTMSRKAISISGNIRNIGSDRLEEIFKKNAYMNEIYPSKASREALEVFCLYRGQGEYFDLSTKPITRDSFVLGGAPLQKGGFLITEKCSSCGICIEKCPQDCIDQGSPYKINQEHCLHCGNCFDVCPVNAVIKAERI
ncbi:4Fe-4S dicluster domain-containing protein [Oceanispirochaeta crateris]|uniref:4Fe-4S dicluster domain-containing protein n=1 Tax=Oceanispirochaeta crateris TaxID=2518645 RepID=A0A5C1QKW4_9SPIO|nr:4Fe-4S binding protein [Oceanispirochaeta crateris]QEN08241.1 4Fe-4S dicluster domain-containing protein [Oceanispirochaeta crateris]